MHHSRPALFFVPIILFLLASATAAEDLSLDARVRHQRAIEQVYWQHMIWPEQNKRAKPELEAVLPETALRNKVEDYLRMSGALEKLWHRPVWQTELRQETERMIRHSKDPGMLADLFAALGNNRELVEECLARPKLVSRLLRNWYSTDSRFHGALKARAAGELARVRTAGDMVSTSGFYHESEWQLERGEQTRQVGAEHGAIYLNQKEWDEWLAQLGNKFQTGKRELPVGVPGRLLEDADRFYAVAVVEKDAGRVKLATIEWRKQPFDIWWKDIRTNFAIDPASVSRSSNASPPIAALARCPADRWDPLPASQPSARYHHTAVWTGAEMIIWGGETYGMSERGGRYDPATDTWQTMTLDGAPEAREQHTAVWSGAEMIVWGGRGSNGWLDSGGRYDPLTDEWTPTTVSNAPAGRYQHTAVWTGEAMIVWGGYAPALWYTNTGGRYDPATDTWYSTTISGAPAARESHTAVWTGAEMIIWGGGGPYNTNATGGRYNPLTDTWIPTATTNATARTWHSAVWTGTEMIVWGGWIYPGLVNSGARYDPLADTWQNISSSAAPGPRHSHSAVWTGSQMIVWGGSPPGGGTLNSGGRYDPALNTWTATAILNAPENRAWHSAVWAGTEMIVWGGDTCDNMNNCTIADDGGRYAPVSNTWLPVAVTGTPAPRYFHTSVWTGTEMIVWGGNVGDPTNTGARYNPALDDWTPTSAINAPAARYIHTAAWTGNQMIVWGGRDITFLNSGGRYDPLSDTWLATSLVNAPSARDEFSSVWTGTEMIVWGGYDNWPLNTGGRYDPAADTWSPTSIEGAPSARYVNTAVWSGTQMIVWGGSYTSPMATGGRYDPVTDSWSPTTMIDAPEQRWMHAAVWTGDRMIIWGGRDGPVLNSGAGYDPAADQWTPMSQADAPEGREQPSAIWTGQAMIAWGGYGLGYLNSGGEYIPESDTWSATKQARAPGPREGHTAVWTGDRMIVWGGYPSTNDGAAYCPNLKPFAADDSYNGNQDSTLNIAEPGVLANDVDPDNDPIQPVLMTQPGNGVVVLSPDGSFRYTPQSGFTGPDTFTYSATDADDSSRPATVTIFVGSCLFCDDFEDSILAPDWTYKNGDWIEMGGQLTGSARKAGPASAIAAPAFAGCRDCRIDTRMMTTGGASGSISLFAWYAGKRDMVELLMKEERDVWTLRQRINGKVAAKASVRLPIEPGAFYHVRLVFDGRLLLYIDDAAQPAITLTPGGEVQAGTIGFQAKHTTAAIEYVSANNP